MYILYIKERHHYVFPLVCPSKKTIKKFEKKVDVQKGVLTLREKLDNKCINFIEFAFSSTLVIW